jgi:hypothetical protein
MRRIAAVFLLIATLGAAYAVLASREEPALGLRVRDPVGDARPLIIVHGRDATRPGDGVPIEGAISFLRLRGPHGFVSYAARFTSPTYDLGYPPNVAGRYRITAYARYCDGNCGYLDAPTGRCSRAFHLGQVEVVTATIRSRSAHRCRIALDRSSG